VQDRLIEQFELGRLSRFEMEDAESFGVSKSRTEGRDGGS